MAFHNTDMGKHFDHTEILADNHIANRHNPFVWEHTAAEAISHVERTMQLRYVQRKVSTSDQFRVINKAKRNFGEHWVRPCGIWDRIRRTHTQGRKGLIKAIHSMGITAQVRVKFAENNGYTGLFANSSDTTENQEGLKGLIRFSFGTQPSIDANGNTRSGPSFGLKIFRDNVHSADIVAAYDFTGQEGTNFFSNILSNNLRHPIKQEFSGDKKKWIETICKRRNPPAEPKNQNQVWHYCNMQGVSDLSTHDQAGTEIEENKFPLAMFFVPNPELTQICQEAADDHEEENELNPQINPFKCFEFIENSGQTLYKVWAVDDFFSREQMEEGDKFKFMGCIDLKKKQEDESNFHMCDFANDQVRFKHEFWRTTIDELSDARKKKYWEFNKQPVDGFGITQEGVMGEKYNGLIPEWDSAVCP